MCAASPPNTKGTYRACTEAPPCGTSLFGNDATAGTNALGEIQRSTLIYPTATLASYPAKVLVAQNVVSNIDGTPLIGVNNDIKFTNATHDNPLLKYYPMFIFTATKKYVTLNSGGAQIQVKGGSGDDDADIEIVLVPWGNKTPNAPDPVLFDTTQTRRIRDRDFTVTNVTPVFASTKMPTNITSRGVYSDVTPGFKGQQVQLTPGLQYAIAMQATIATNDYVTMSWQAFSATVPAVAFSDNF